MKIVRFLSLVLVASVAFFASTALAAEGTPSKPATTTPAPRNKPDLVKRHKMMNERVKKGNVDLLMIGDSITQGWEGKGGQSVWNKYYGKRNAVNLGIGGDQTQHVLWRLENGNIAGISPSWPSS